MKRFAVTSITRDREYNLTKGEKGSRVMYFSANPNGEAELLKVTLKPRPRLKKLIFDVDFSELSIKGRQSMGNLLTKMDVHKISMKEKGVSTLGGRKIYFDKDVLRLNADKRGTFLGEFHGDDRIFVLTKNGEFELYNFDLENHFSDNILVIEKFNPEKVISVVYWDEDQKLYYVKRFQIDGDTSINRPQNFIGENSKNKLISITWVHYPRFELEFSGDNKERENEIIEVAEFIGVKSFKAKGKRLTNYHVGKIKELEPIVKDEDEHPEPLEEPEDTGDDNDDVPFEINRKKEEDEEDDKNQMSLF